MRLDRRQRQLATGPLHRLGLSAERRQHRSQIGQTRMLEYRLGRQLPASFTQPRDQTQGLDRVAAQGEELGIAADLANTEQLGP